MSPREVQGLQALAVKNGGSLTINPETGLPEAGFLDKLLPAIIGAGISYFSGGTIDPKTAAMIVGGVETARTGDIGKGISAGLGAYGGATLTSGFTAAGTETLGAQATGTAAQTAGELAAAEAGRLGLEQGLTGEALEMAKAQAMDQVASATSGVAANATPYETLSAGVNKAAASPMDFLKANAKPLMYTAAPLLAGDATQAKMPQTVTKPGMIRPYSFDPYGGTYTAGTPYEAAPTRAAEGGLMGMNNGGYSPGQLDFTQRSEPVVRMASGGIAALAGGGMPANYDQNYVNQLVREAAIQAGGSLSYADASTAAKNLGISDDMLRTAASNTLFITGAPRPVADPAPAAVVAAPAATQSAYGPGSMAAALGASHIVDGVQIIPGAPGYDPAKAAMRLAEISTYGDTGAAATLKANNLYDTGMSQWQAEYNRLLQQDIAAGLVPASASSTPLGNQPASVGGTGTVTGIGVAAPLPGSDQYTQNVQNWFRDNPNATYADIQKAMSLYGLSPEDVKAAMAKAGLSGGAQFAAFNQTIGDTRNVDETYSGLKGLSSNINYWLQRNPGASLNDFRNEMRKYELNEDDIKRATGKTSAELFTGKLTTVFNPAEGASGATGPGAIGGGTVVNPNGTITTSPRIPGIPEGGFTGMGQVRDEYTKGGGQLGYVSPTYTPEEFQKKYVDRLTGGSKQSYDYLTGKTKYDPTPYTPTGEIQKPYWESVGRFPENRSTKKYVYVDGKYQLNPDYVKPSYVLAGEKAAALANQDKEPTDSPGAGNKWVWNSTDKKWEAKPVADITADGGEQGAANGLQQGAANGGLMAMAGGGMSSQFNLGGYSDGGRLLRGPGDGVSDSIPATIGNKRPARLADGEFVVPARIVSELGNGSTEAGARKLYAMMERVQAARRGTVGKKKVAKNSRADRYLPA
jgi:hypothetical protein